MLASLLDSWTVKWYFLKRINECELSFCSSQVSQASCFPFLFNPPEHSSQLWLDTFHIWFGQVSHLILWYFILILIWVGVLQVWVCLGFNSDIFWPCLQMWSTACNLWLPCASKPIFCTFLLRTHFIFVPRPLHWKRAKVFTTSCFIYYWTLLSLALATYSCHVTFPL